MKKLVNTKNEIQSILSNFKRTFYTIGVFSAIINLLALVPSLYMLQVYDRVLNSRNEITLLMLTLLMLALRLYGGPRAGAFLRAGARGRQVRHGAEQAGLHRRLRAKPEVGRVQRRTGAGDLTNVRQFLTGNACSPSFDAPWFPIYLIVIFVFEPCLGLFALCGTLVLIVLASSTNALPRSR
jgi:ATP-binding cassette subfamily C exporter for protease/lipase